MSLPNDALGREEKETLLEVARRSIRFGLRHNIPLDVDPPNYPETLSRIQSSFVTLKTPDDQLRGCIGSLEARMELVRDVAMHAFAAASRDPRFPPLDEAEFERIRISISVLSPSKPLQADSEQHLRQQLQPGRDGLILRMGNKQATFLPAVWESLPNPEEFLAQLKRKAGLPPDFWSEHMEIHRYQSLSITETPKDGE